MEKPEVPKHPICDRTMHADTLHRCEYILDLLSDLDEANEGNVNARTGYYWVNRMIADSLRYVADSLSYKAYKKRQRKRAKRD